MSRRITMFVRLFAVVGLLGSCGDLEEELQGEPCTVQADCWHTQECTRTLDEATLGLPGVCEPEGTGCVVGQQIGCMCNPNDPATNCTVPAVPIQLQASYPKMVCHPTLFLCAVAPPSGSQP